MNTLILDGIRKQAGSRSYLALRLGALGGLFGGGIGVYADKENIKRGLLRGILIGGGAGAGIGGLLGHGISRNMSKTFRDLIDGTK